MPKKKASGAAGRARKRGTEEAADDAEHAASRPDDLEAGWLKSYKAIGPPPADVVGRCEWAQRMLAQALFETTTDPGTSPRERRRVVGDLGAKIGMTAVKALYEERLKSLEEKVYGRTKRERKHGTDGLEEFPAKA